MEETNHAIARWLTEAGWSETYVNLAVKAVIILGIFVVAYAAAVLFRRLVVPLLQKISARTKAVWDDHLFSDKVMHRAARLIPPLIWYVLLRVAFYDTPVLLNVLHKACLIYLIVAVLQLVAAFLDTLYEISSRHETLRNRPLKGVYQMIKLLAVCVGAILIVSILIGQDATAVLAGLGASAAIIMLIFRDSILGLVAGVQLSANDMLRPGDWITMAKYGADGYVTEVTLTTVKVQNFDKTITTIPPYALVSDSFQNWRGMQASGGRRVKRSVSIDMTSVRFCTPEMLNKYRSIDLIREYIDDTERRVEEYNAAHGIKPGERRINGLHQTNLGVFRAYLERYLRNEVPVNAGMTLMVRQLQPTETGLPMELYFFTDTVIWVDYERIQSDVFDHVLAVIPEFDLRVFQNPSGSDIAALRYLKPEPGMGRKMEQRRGPDRAPEPEPKQKPEPTPTQEPMPKQEPESGRKPEPTP